MTPELLELLRQIDATKADGHAVCAGLSESQFNWWTAKAVEIGYWIPVQ